MTMMIMWVVMFLLMAWLLPVLLRPWFVGAGSGVVGGGDGGGGGGGGGVDCACPQVVVVSGMDVLLAT